MTEPATPVPRSPRATPPTIAIVGRVDPEDVLRLCDELRDAAANTESTTISCDVRRIVRPDIGTIGALARLALMSRRLGCRLELDGTPSDLGELLVLAGLAGSVVEVVGQPEEREEPLGVQEERDRGDPIA